MASALPASLPLEPQLLPFKRLSLSESVREDANYEHWQLINLARNFLTAHQTGEEAPQSLRSEPSNTKNLKLSQGKEGNRRKLFDVQASGLHPRETVGNPPICQPPLSESPRTSVMCERALKHDHPSRTSDLRVWEQRCLCGRPDRRTTVRCIARPGAP